MNIEEVDETCEKLHKLFSMANEAGEKLVAIKNIPVEYLKFTIEALEKQISKKLEVWADGTEHCPNCEHDNSCLGFKVCVKCGQKLDWKVEE